MNARIAYYISSHGYGHAARQQAVLGQLAARGAQVYVRTRAPRKFFTKAYHYHEQAYDVGMIQRDALNFDIPASLQWYADFLKQQNALIQAELAFIHAEKIQLVVSDMPPIAFEIAHQAGLPSVALTHFTWDWVYEHYINEFPHYRFLIEAIQAQYHKATLALQMQIPMPHDFSIFPRVEPVPLIYNAATESKAALRQKFAVPEGYRLALLSMGGHDWGTSDIRALTQVKNWIFLVMPTAWEQVQAYPQFRPVPMDYPNYHNLIAGADLVVGKAGGSTVAEVLGHRTPMLYTLQDHWREAALLDQTLQTYAVSQHIPLTQFMAGDWIDCIAPLLAHESTWREIELNGASLTAERLLRLLSHA